MRSCEGSADETRGLAGRREHELLSEEFSEWFCEAIGPTGSFAGSQYDGEISASGVRSSAQKNCLATIDRFRRIGVSNDINPAEQRRI